MGKPKGSTGNVVLTDVRAKTALQQKSPGVQKKTSTVEDGAAKKGKSFIDDLFATSKKECQSKTTKPGKQETGSPDEAPARRKARPLGGSVSFNLHPSDQLFIYHCMIVHRKLEARKTTCLGWLMRQERRQRKAGTCTRRPS